MSDKYNKYHDNFIKDVAKNNSKPSAFKGKPQILSPDDDDEAVAEYFKAKKFKEDKKS